MLGENLRALSDRAIAHWRNVHIGFIFQSFNLIPVLTALENVELPLKLTNLNKKERLEHAGRALKLVSLGDRLITFRVSCPVVRNSVSRSRGRSSPIPISFWRTSHGKPGRYFRPGCVDTAVPSEQGIRENDHHGHP